MPDLLTPAEVADRLHVHVDTLKRWRREGRGPRYTRLDGGTIRYSDDALKQWLVAREAEVAQA